MRYGVCIGSDASKIKTAKEAGFDYVEGCFDLLTKDEENYGRYYDELVKNGIKCESVNCFLPGQLKTTGPEVDWFALSEYIEKGMSKAEKLGIETVVYGSGGSKQVPEGFPFAEAYRQIVYFLKEIAAPAAEKYGITVVVEPLWDCNIIQRVKEGVIVSSLADNAHIAGLGDLFHMEKTGDTSKDITDCAGSIKHAHIAHPGDRKYPSPDDGYDYKEFIGALEKAGCPRCSVEAGTDDFAADAVKAAAAFGLSK